MTKDGREVWSIINNDGSFSAKWYTGDKKNHPSLVGFPHIEVLPTDINYGAVVTHKINVHRGIYNGWNPGNVIGVDATETHLTLIDYNKGRNLGGMVLTLKK